MMETEQYSDDHLTAYLDGELEVAAMEETRLAIENDPKLAERLEALDFDQEKLRLAMDPLLAIAPAMPELPVDLKTDTEERVASWSRNFRSIAAVIALMIIGGAGGFWLNQKPQDGWKDYVAAYHLLYINSTLASVKDNQAVQTEELARISAAIAKPVSLDNVSQVAGLDYKRAQILGFKGKPLAQMTFLSKMGEPVALCIIRTDKPGSTSPQAEQLEGMASASWTNKGYSYLLIGGKDKILISEAAEKFAKLL